MAIRQSNIYRILSANVKLALPFIIGVTCNLSVDCRIEKTAINERIYRSKMQEKKLDYKSIGLNSSKYEITSIDKNEELNYEIINVKTFYDK